MFSYMYKNVYVHGGVIYVSKELGNDLNVASVMERPHNVICSRLTERGKVL